MGNSVFYQKLSKKGNFFSLNKHDLYTRIVGIFHVNNKAINPRTSTSVSLPCIGRRLKGATNTTLTVGVLFHYPDLFSYL